jgi:predicted AlkP superfamily phosphohydrolase/phosphomutase
MTNFRSSLRRYPAPILALALAAVILPACRQADPDEGSTYPSLPPRNRDRQPVVVVGIDGAEWKVIRKMWAAGDLPNLRRLSETGISAVLKTAYGPSPVIWTTIATGRAPEHHGITDFVVTTERGAVPVSSALRRVPALWNMASRAGLRTAVLGWWATWPAEEIAGVMVTDRAHLDLDRILHPDSYLPVFRQERGHAAREYAGFGGRLPIPDPWMEDGAFRDRIMAHEARRLIGLGFDLFLVYFRTVDIASHRYWKFYEPDRYEGIAASDVETSSHIIPAVYQATDEALGDLLAACPEGSHVFVLSDHGFFAGPEEFLVYLSLDRLLEHLGFLVRDGAGIDFSRSVAYPVDSPDHARVKMMRLSLAGREPSGRIAAGEAGEELERLTTALEGVTYRDGGAVFRVRRSNLPQGVDLIAEVNLENPSREVLAGRDSYDDVVFYINRISGTHNESTDGIFIASGPDLIAGAPLEAISITDIAPTILYALGLPVAEDFPGRVQVGMFTEAFRAGHPLRTVPSWGTMEAWGVETSPADRRLMEELRALGYLSP